jgi:hypothetical protein
VDANDRTKKPRFSWKFLALVVFVLTLMFGSLLFVYLLSVGSAGGVR